ncbi:OmpA family protein [Acinetobacter nematophilus]|uniref:OmpA family protein n=1 Tax=Acinetobacter nematophilus TaxID=2994642 RepID=UPI003AF5AF40
MLNQKKLSSFLLLLVFPTLGLIGCSKPEKAEVITAESSASSVTPETVKTESIENTFDLSQIPISNITLGQFPYISLPNGYQFHDATTVNFERIPFWTGQHIENIEGKLYSAAIQQNEDYKEGSFLELQRNLENVIQQLGGKQITVSKIPQQELDKLPQKFQVDYVAGLGDIFNNPTQTFVVRQANKNIWFQLTQTGNGNAGLLVAETKPVEITAKVLNSDQLKTALDKDSKVNIEVNFATDQANILPQSQPQIAQVIQLLKNNPELKLSIHGHTDGSGDAKHNQTLSEQRANAVVNALTANTGIQQNRLTAKGFGDTQPVAENSTENGKALNRRVELIKSHSPS